MSDERTVQNLSNNQQLAAELSRFATFAELRRSSFYAAHEKTLARLLNEPRVYPCENVQPRLQSFLRVVEWNIERGARLEGIIEALNHHTILKFADLLLLNELDDGMARSRNLNVPLELSQALSAHAIFGVEYLELTKGAGDERTVPGENTTALHGNAILTRRDFSNQRVIRLPRCENNFESAERRIGGRIGILLELEAGSRGFVIANTHLDVTNTPRCRASQMRALLKAIEECARGNRAGSALIGGDLNTHTFARGTRLRAMKNTATILTANPEKLRQRLIHPESREPAVRELERFGYVTEGFNDVNPTSRSVVSNLDDPRGLPRPMKWWVNRRLGSEGLLLEFRLDWIAARGLRALEANEVTDEKTGVPSVNAQTIAGLTHNGSQLSDHDPIVVDIAI